MNEVVEGIVANIREDGSYPVKSENGRIIMVKNCPLWFGTGDKISYQVTDLLRDKKFDIGKYMPRTKYGTVLRVDGRGAIVRPPSGRKFVKIKRSQLWIQEGDKIPYELTQERPDQNTDIGILADKSIGGSMIIVTYFLSDMDQIRNQPEGMYFCVMGSGGNLFKRIESEIWNKHFMTVGEEFMRSDKSVSERGFSYQVGGHQNIEFLQKVLGRELHNFDINNGRLRTRNHFIMLEEVVLNDEETEYINGLDMISFHGIVDTLRDNSEQALAEELFKIP